MQAAFALPNYLRPSANPYARIVVLQKQSNRPVLLANAIFYIFVIFPGYEVKIPICVRMVKIWLHLQCRMIVLKLIKFRTTNSQ